MSTQDYKTLTSELGFHDDVQLESMTHDLVAKVLKLNEPLTNVYSHFQLFRNW